MLGVTPRVRVRAAGLGFNHIYSGCLIQIHATIIVNAYQTTEQNRTCAAISERIDHYLHRNTLGNPISY